MWKTLGLTLSSSTAVSALELLDWNSVADAQTSHKSQLAQLMSEIEQSSSSSSSSTNVDQLYRMCVQDFQLLVTQVKDIINRLEELKKVTIPAQAVALWDKRGIAESVRSLDALRIEFQQAVDDGTFVPATPVDVTPFLETENADLCSVLNEFDKIKRAITVKHQELDKEQAFSDWLADLTAIPAVCTEKIQEFEEARENLASICAGAEEYKEFQLMELYDETVRMDLTDSTTTFAEFKEAILTAFNTVVIPDYLRTPLLDFKPESVPECDFLTNSIAAEIDALAVDKKEIQDCLAFAPFYQCDQIASQLQQDTQEIVLQNSAKLAEIDSEVALLLLANPALAASEGELLINLSFGFQSSPLFGRPTGNVIAFQNPPPSCDNPSNQVRNSLLQLRSRAAECDNNENFLMYVKDQMAGACTTPFEEQIMSYMNIITGQTQEKNQIVEWLLMSYQELGFPIEKKDFIANFETKFGMAKEDPAFTTGFSDPFTVPSIEVQCQDAVAAGNYLDQIMDKRETAQDMFDFNVYLTDEVCGLIDARLAQLISDNAASLDESQLNIQRILQSMASFGEITDTEGFYRFQRQQYDAAIASGDLTLEDPGFVNPITMYPSSHCSGEFTWELLNTLRQETEDAKTYEAFLSDRVEAQCENNGLQATLDLLNNYISQEQLRKQQQLEDLYPILAPEGQTQAEFDEVNRGMFETARMEGSVADVFRPPSIFSFPDACGPEVNALEEAVIAAVDEARELTNCLFFTTETLCARLDNKILSCIDSNTIDARNFQTLIDQKLAALFPVDAETDETFDMFQVRMQAEYNAALRHGYFVATDSADLCGLPTEIPATCAEPGPNMVDFDNLATRQYELNIASNYNRFLDERVAQAVQISMDLHLTRRAIIWGEITAEQERKRDLLNELYTDFDISVPLEQFITEIESEFRMAVANNAIMNPAVVDRMFPPVPAGQEATVQDERDVIDGKAAELEELLDFNNFVKDHVCESRADLYEQQCIVVDAAIAGQKAIKQNMLQSVFEVEGRSNLSETFDEFCERLIGEFDALFGTAVPAPLSPYTAVAYPTVTIPDDCDDAETAQQNLIDKLDEITKLLSFQDWVQPRITDNAALLQQCMEDEVTIQEAVKNSFPRWTQCIATKIDVLNTLYDQSDKSLAFDPFIESVREQFDILKDNNQIILVDPMVRLPDGQSPPEMVNVNCPKSTHDQLAIGQAFGDVLQDCLSYLEWCQVQQTGMCDATVYEATYNDNLPLLTAEQDVRQTKVFDLFTLKVEQENSGVIADRLEAVEQFRDTLIERFDESPPTPAVVTEISTVTVPLLCSIESRTAAETLNQLVVDLTRARTINMYLDEQLIECCQELATAYEGLVALETMADRITPLQNQRNSLLDSIEVYKNTGGAPRATWEAGFMSGYTAPVSYPTLPFDHALIDIPESCITLDPNADAASQALFQIALDIAKQEDENEWLRQELIDCITNANQQLVLQSQLLLNEFNVLSNDVNAVAMELAMIEGTDPTLFQSFLDSLRDEFNGLLADGLVPLVAPQNPVTNIPDGSDMIAQMALQQVQDGIESVQIEQSFLNWLNQKMEDDCRRFESIVNALIDPTLLSTLDAEIATKQSNLFALMPTPFPGSSLGQPSTLGLAVDALNAAYAAAEGGLIPEDSLIGTPLIPTVCASYTVEEEQALDTFRTQVSAKRTECAWLDDLIAEECQEDDNTLDAIISNSLPTNQFLVNKNADCLAKIESISTTMTGAGITAEFEATYVPGITNALACNGFLPDVQEACGQGLLDLEQAAIGICQAVDRGAQFDMLLQTKKVAACAEQNNDITNRLNTLEALPGCSTLDSDWAILYQCQGDGFNNLDAFIANTLATEFNPQYNSFAITRESVGVFPVAQVPDICTAEEQQLGLDLLTQVEEATQAATLCAWAQRQVAEACATKNTMLQTLLLDNQSRLPAAQGESETLLQNLFLLSSSSNLALFRDDKLDEYQLLGRDLNGVAVGIDIPSVADACRDVAGDSLTALLNFIQSLRVELDFADWLEDQLSQMCMVDVLNDLTSLETRIMSDLTQCDDVDVIALQNDIYSFQDASVDQTTFIAGLNSEFDGLYSSNAIIGMDTGYILPLTPDVCLQQMAITDKISDVTTKDQALSKCLAEKMWLEDRLAAQCAPFSDLLESSRLSFELELQTIGFANDAKLDDLAMCLGRVDGSVLDAEKRAELASPGDTTPVGTTDLLVPTNMGCDSLEPVLVELRGTRDMIISEKTYSNFLDAELDGCVTTIVPQLASQTAALESMFNDLATCSAVLPSQAPLAFKGTLGLPGETDEDFLARLTSERMAADASQYPLGIDLFGTSAVNPLPSTASAGAKQQEAAYQAALARVRAETDLCSSTTAPNWLADQVGAVCTTQRLALQAAEAALSTAQAPLTAELNSKLLTLQNAEGNTDSLAVYEAAKIVEMGLPMPQVHDFVFIDNNFACVPPVDATTYNTALSDYETDLQLLDFVMGELGTYCSTLDLTMDRLQAMQLLLQLQAKNEALEQIILTAAGAGTVESVLASLGLSIETVVGAQTADIDLARYQVFSDTCGIDISGLQNDVAQINEAYKRCKMLTMAAESVLTDTLVMLATARDNDFISMLDYDQLSDELINQLFALSGESDLIAFEAALEASLQAANRVTMLAQTSSTIQLDADLEQGGQGGLTGQRDDALALLQSLQGRLLSLQGFLQLLANIREEPPAPVCPLTEEGVRQEIFALQTEGNRIFGKEQSTMSAFGELFGFTQTQINQQLFSYDQAVQNGAFTPPQEEIAWEQIAVPTVEDGCNEQLRILVFQRNNLVEQVQYYATRCAFWTESLVENCRIRKSTFESDKDSETAALDQCMTDLDNARTAFRAVDTANTDLDRASYDANLERCFERARAASPADERCDTYDQTVVESTRSTFVASTPNQCEALGVTGIDELAIDIRSLKFQITHCITENEWVLLQLGDQACPSATQFDILIGEVFGLIATEQTVVQAPILTQLFQFKGIAIDNGDVDLMSLRMFDTLFPDTNTDPLLLPLDPAIAVPEVPFYCPSSIMTAQSNLEAAIVRLQKQRTFSLFLQNALNACCESLKEDTEAMMVEATARMSELNGQITSKINALIELAGANGSLTTANSWQFALAVEDLAPPAAGTEFPEFVFNPVTCNLATQNLVQVTLPLASLDVESLKQDLAWYEGEAAEQCTTLESGGALAPHTTSNGRVLAPDTCDSIRAGLVGQMTAINPSFGGLSLTETRAAVDFVSSFTAVNLGIPTVSSQSLECCDASVSVYLSSATAFEECINDVERFDSYLSLFSPP